MESGLYEPRLAKRADDGVLLRIAEHDAVEGGGEIENDDAPDTKYDRATADEASAAMARREYFVMVQYNDTMSSIMSSSTDVLPCAAWRSGDCIGPAWRHDRLMSL